MKRHWVYYRSPYHGDDRILATLRDEDGAGYTLRHLHLPDQPETHHAGRLREQQWLWRISEAEALRILALRKKAQP